MTLPRVTAGMTEVHQPRLVLDPRFGQMVTQGTFLLLQLTWLDFGPEPVQVAVFIATALAIELAHARWTGRGLNWKSALSAGLSLSLLLRAHEPLIWVAASGLAMGSKFLLRVRGKHVFNPSAFAIVTLLFVSPHVWVSPGQWGTAFWVGAFVLTMGWLVLARVERLDLALTFLATHFALLCARALYLSDPLSIPLHQIQSGSVLIFAVFMLTDPRSTPDSRTGRLVFGVAVAAVAQFLLFQSQIREGVFYALIVVSCLTPLIDRTWPGERFKWPEAKGA